MALLGLQAVDAEDDPRRAAVGQSEIVRILLSGGEDRLVAGYVAFYGVLRAVDLIGVLELLADLRYAPVPCDAALTNPGEHVPADAQARGRHDELGARADGVSACRTLGVHAVGEFGDDVKGAIEDIHVAVAMIADGESIEAADRTAGVGFQHQAIEDGIGRPTMR